MMIEPKIIHILKNLALRGARENYIYITTTELGEELNMSQQSASRWLKKMKKLNLIIEEREERKIKVKITRKGTEILQREFYDYRRIFESPKYIEITGEVISGLGEGKYYITKKEYYEQIKEKLFFEPYPGTLNVRVYPKDLENVEILKGMPSILIKGFQSRGRTYGNVKAYLCTINGLEASLIIPERTHYTDVVEIISHKNLRKELNLKDGDPVNIVVFL